MRRGRNKQRLWRIVTFVAVTLAFYTNMWLLRQPEWVFTQLTSSVKCDCPEVATQTFGVINDDPISTLDLDLGRWDDYRSYKLFNYAAVGDMYAQISSHRQVCLATQTSVDRLHELLRIADHWSGPISVAVFVTGDELRLLRVFVRWLFNCQPAVYDRIAMHVSFHKDRPGIHGILPKWSKNCTNPCFPPKRKDMVQGKKEQHLYPQNHMRNLATSNCQTVYVFLVDVDIIPSKGMAEDFDIFLESAPECQFCAYVIPTYEVDRRITPFPANKSELLRSVKLKRAAPFHEKVFIHNQFATNFSRWEESDGNESSWTHVSHNVTAFEFFYEPFYVAARNVPKYDERFVGYGFTRNTQNLLLTITNTIGPAVHA